MMSALVSLLESWSNSRSIVFIRDSSYGMPAVQSVHLVGLTVLLAAIVILDVRLAGVGMKDWSLPSLERQLRPLALGALTLVMASGVPIFWARPQSTWRCSFRVQDDRARAGDCVAVRPAPPVLHVGTRYPPPVNQCRCRRPFSDVVVSRRLGGTRDCLCLAKRCIVGPPGGFPMTRRILISLAITRSSPSRTAPWPITT